MIPSDVDDAICAYLSRTRVSSLSYPGCVDDAVCVSQTDLTTPHSRPRRDVGCGPFARLARRVVAARPIWFRGVRDQAARMEATAVARATQLADIATDCASCPSTLRDVASSSQARLEAPGGLRTCGRATPEGIRPASVSDAPTDVPAYVSWLARTATRDLEIANPTRPKRHARLRAGRYASAVPLTSTASISRPAMTRRNSSTTACYRVASG